MTPELFQTIERDGACVDLSDRAKFRLTGADCFRYLNGQVTNDVRKATEDSALRACVTNAKGRIEAEVFIHVSPTDNSLWLDTEPGLREALSARLDRYIVADDVTIGDVTDEWRMLHCFAGREQAAGSCESFPDMASIRCSRFGTPGVDLWLPASTAMPPARGSLLSAGEVEMLRILRGIPRWPHELNVDAFPQEAGLEATAMDFAKGCYIGQEVLSRIKLTGKMPRLLRKFQVSNLKFQVEPGMKLMAGDATGPAKEAGVVTSVARHPVLDRWVGLGYVRQVFADVDSLLLACEDPPRILSDVKISPP